jgi:hypothetical protein
MADFGESERKICKNCERFCGFAWGRGGTCTLELPPFVDRDHRNIKQEVKDGDWCSFFLE